MRPTAPLLVLVRDRTALASNVVQVSTISSVARLVAERPDLGSMALASSPPALTRAGEEPGARCREKTRVPQGGSVSDEQRARRGENDRNTVQERSEKRDTKRKEDGKWEKKVREERKEAAGQKRKGEGGPFLCRPFNKSRGHQRASQRAWLTKNSLPRGQQPRRVLCAPATRISFSWAAAAHCLPRGTCNDARDDVALFAIRTNAPSASRWRVPLCSH